MPTIGEFGPEPRASVQLGHRPDCQRLRDELCGNLVQIACLSYELPLNMMVLLAYISNFNLNVYDCGSDMSHWPATARLKLLQVRDADAVGTSRVSNCRLFVSHYSRETEPFLQLAPMSHPASKRIRLNCSLTSDSSHVSKKTSPRLITSEPSLFDDVDKIVSQNVKYMTALEEHVAAIRGHPQ